MLHIRVDDKELNSKARFACGLGWPLPEGDKYLFMSEDHKAAAYFEAHAEQQPCPGCFPNGKPQFGIPLSQLTWRQYERLEAEYLEPPE
jgi:hypothetical protein